MRKKTGRLACFFLGHNYLPEKKTMKHWDGTEKELDYLKCPRCGAKYYFAFHEQWHIAWEWKMWKAAVKRAKAQGVSQ